MENKIIEDVESALDDLYQRLKQIKENKNQIFALIDIDIIFLWHRLNMLLAFFVDHGNFDKLSNILTTRDFFKKYKYLTNEYYNLYKSNRRSIGKFYHDCAWKKESSLYSLDATTATEEKDADIAVFKRFYSELEDKDNLIEYLLEKTTGVRPVGPFDDVEDYYYYKFLDTTTENIESTTQFFEKLFKIFMLFSSYDSVLLKKVSFEDKTLRNILDRDLKSHTKESRKYFERKLTREASRHKANRSASLTPEVWGNILNIDDEAIDLAIKGKFVSSTDTRFEFYDEEMRKKMERNYELLQKVKDVSQDNELFDFDYAFEPHINLSAHLNNDNIDFFFDIILRRNLIQCGMYPEVKRKFDDWLNIKPAQSEDSYRIETLSEDARGWLLRKEIYPKLAKLLNDEVKPYVDRTKAQNWDCICFLCKIFGIVPQNLARKDFAKLLTEIVAGLGEAKKLDQNMQALGINWKQIQKNFDYDKQSSNVKAALAPFYDKFKNL